MSFELYVNAFRAGEPLEFPIAILEEVFGEFVQRKDGDCWLLEFSDGGAPEIYLGDAATLTDFMVSRPPPSPQFWSALLEAMRRTKSVCYWPGCANPVVADDSTAKELPGDMIEALGEPIFVGDPAAFFAAIEQ